MSNLNSINNDHKVHSTQLEYEFVDSHAHLVAPQYKNKIGEVITKARNAGVTKIISIGSGYGKENIYNAVRLTDYYKRIYATMGIHPHEAQTFHGSIQEILSSLRVNGKIVAIGEIGLDYYKKYSPVDIQEKVFKEQLLVSREAGLPVVIHDRDAHSRVVEILKDHGSTLYPAGVIHCFSGGVNEAKKFLDLGYYISIPGIITFKKTNALVDVVRSMPLDCLLLETDSPFLAPVPFRGELNEPANIPLIADKISEIKGVSIEEIAEITTSNVLKLFKLNEIEESLKNSVFTYKHKRNLYLNITNRCNNSCAFCPKHVWEYRLWGMDLKIPVEPSVENVIERIGNPSLYNEIVFCGLGEPLQRFEVLKKIASWLKLKGARVRVNTDGLANKVHGRNIGFELVDLVDVISVSLNAHDASTYVKVTRTPFGESAWFEVKKFIHAMINAGIKVLVSVVTYPGVDIEKCRKLVFDEFGISLRVRQYR